LRLVWLVNSSSLPSSCSLFSFSFQFYSFLCYGVGPWLLHSLFQPSRKEICTAFSCCSFSIDDPEHVKILGLFERVHNVLWDHDTTHSPTYRWTLVWCNSQMMSPILIFSFFVQSQ
jgi:hypothetical protein